MEAVETDLDPLRERLLDAAARVFAQKGYAGTRILDVVSEAGLSTGAVYGRFASKNALLREAVCSRTTRVPADVDRDAKVADVLVRAALRTEPLSDAEAMQLEAYVAARREPEVAQALSEEAEGFRTRAAALLEAARGDGTLSKQIEADAFLYFIRTFRLGLMLQRAARVPAPDNGWEELIERMVAAFGSDCDGLREPNSTRGEP
jgi:AcrR family transcriptional regulator